MSSVTYYEYHKGRTQEASDLFLESYSGALQTDAYVVYDKHLGIKLGCMAHARRYFMKAKKLAPKECAHVLRMISELYKIEKELKKTRGKLPLEDWFEERRRVRLEKSKPILDTLKKYLLKHKGSWLLEEHPMYKAINYMLVRFNVFAEYIHDGKYEIDNNHVERAIRPVAIGRRNWLFAGSQHGAKMSAVLMTVIQSCKQLGINPQKYLRDVLPRLANHNTTTLTGLTPLDWEPA